MTPLKQHFRNQSNNLLMLLMVPHDVGNYSISAVNPGPKEQPPVTISACQVSATTCPAVPPCTPGRVQPCSAQTPTETISPLLGKCHALICGRAQQVLQHKQGNMRRRRRVTPAGTNAWIGKGDTSFKSCVSSKGSKQGEETNLVLLPPTDRQMQKWVNVQIMKAQSAIQLLPRTAHVAGELLHAGRLCLQECWEDAFPLPGRLWRKSWNAVSPVGDSAVT